MNKIGKNVVTQQVIAREAKVHLSTVSLALRNDPRIPQPTRDHIQAVARSLGYTPNPLVSLLMARVRRSNAAYRGTLAYVHTAQRGSPLLAGPVHRNFFAGAKRRAGELGYNLTEIFLTPGELNARRLPSMLQARGIVGLVIEHAPGPLCPDRQLPFDVAGFAAVALGIPLAKPQLHYVANDQYMRPILAAREVLKLGYRRLGLVVADQFDSAMAHRCSAGFWAVHEYIADLASLPVCRVREDEPEKLAAWINRHRPDVVLGTSHSILTQLRTLGWNVPRDLGWVHLDWLPDHKPAAGVHGNSEHTGAAAIELVVSQLHRGEVGEPGHTMSHLVAGTWMPGRTVRKIGPPIDLDVEFFAAR